MYEELKFVYIYENKFLRCFSRSVYNAPFDSFRYTVPFKSPGFPYRDSVTRFFASGFFHESVSPQPQSIPLGTFRIFRKFAEIFASKGAPPVSMTPAANFATSLASVVDTGGKFAIGVNDTGGK
jgi:hypothetical protein